MARTPLLRSLQQLFRDHWLGRAHGVAPSTIRALRQEALERRALGEPLPTPPPIVAPHDPSRLTRRGFLGSVAAGTAVLALPRRAGAARTQPRIAIIGGGIAGLTCAVRLADRGIRSTVYEASGRLGGRMFSNTRSWAEDQVTEWGGELIDTGHTTIRKLAHRFDLPLDDLLAAEPAGSQDTDFFFGRYYPKASADSDFAEIFPALTADADAAPFPTTFDSFTAAGASLDHMSVYDYIESRVPGGHASPLGQLLEQAYAIEYAADTRVQASLNLLYLLAFQPDETSLAIFGESDERSHIRGGNQQLPLRMAASLGDAVTLGHRLVRLAKTAGGRYELTFERAGGTTETVADFVVLALPFAVLRGIDTAGAGFDDLKDEAIQELGRGHSGKLQLQFRDRLWNQTGPWPGRGNGSSYSDTGYQSGWEATRAQPGRNGILVFFSGGSIADAAHTAGPFATIGQAGVAADAARALAQIEPVFPGLSARWNGRATQSLPQKSPFFNLSYAYYRIGQYTAFGGFEKVRQGGILFCGEHTSTDFQGFMEGGASEGKRAARELAKLIDGRDDLDAGF